MRDFLKSIEVNHLTLNKDESFTEFESHLKPLSNINNLFVIVNQSSFQCSESTSFFFNQVYLQTKDNFKF
jgi:hypothetical protein